MALNFPAAPVDGALYPSPAIPGVGQWRWSLATTSWISVPFYMQVREGDYNNYNWPNSDGTLSQQLNTDGSGNLFWASDLTVSPEFQLLGLLESFDGVNVAFTLVELGSSVPFTPSPSTNIAVFLGGVPQIPVASYTVSGNTITFSEPPLFGATFYAISSIIVSS